MSEENYENSKIKSYLLGQVTDDPEQIEARIMTDDDFFENFLAAEEELIQSYVDGDLTENEKIRFEGHFLISEERQRKLSFARAFRRNLDNLTGEVNSPVPSPGRPAQTGAEPIYAGLFSKYLSNPVPALAAILLVAALVGTVLYFYQGSAQPTPLETEFARLNQEDFGDTAKYSKFSGLSLLAGTNRSRGNTDKLTEKALTDRIFLRLALPPTAGEDPAEVFKVEVSSSQKIMFTQTGIRPYQNPNGRELRFLIPASVLGKGTYQITAKGSQSDEFSYFFDVE